MAITIQQQPASYPCLNDDLFWAVTSTNSGQTGFKFVCDVYEGSTLVSRLKVFPASNGYGYFNVANVVRSMIDARPKGVDNGDFVSAYESFQKYTLKFGEEYGGTLYTNLTTSTDNKAYNYVQPLFPDWSTNVLTGYEYKWLTSRDLAQALEINYDDRLIISSFAPSGESDYRIGVSVDGGAAQILASTSESFASGTANMFDISPASINAKYASTVIPSTASVYTFDASGLSSNQVYPRITVNLKCRKYENYTLMFLNSVGGYDSFTFDLVSKREYNAERKGYEQVGWGIDSSDDMVNRRDGFMIGGRNNYNISQTVIFRLVSNWVSQKDHDWLRDLVMSPYVFMYKSGYWYPVTVSTAQWVEKLRISDKNFNLTLEVNYYRRVYSQGR